MLHVRRLPRPVRTDRTLGDAGASTVEQALLVAAIAAVLTGVAFGVSSELQGFLGSSCPPTATASASATSGQPAPGCSRTP